MADVNAEIKELKNTLEKFSAAFIAKQKFEADIKEQMEKDGKAVAESIDKLAKVDETVVKLVDDAAKAAERLETLEKALTAAQRHGKGDEEKAGPFRGLGDQLIEVRNVMANGASKDKLLEVKAPLGMSEQVQADGGYLVQTDISGELLTRTYTQGEILSRVRRIPISANSNSLVMYGINETSRVAGSRFGGVSAAWVGETGTGTASKPSLRRMQLVLKKLIGSCYATDELLQDAAALQAVIMEAFPEEFTFKIEDSFINGNGVAQPLGILNSGAVVTVEAEGGQPALSIVPENITKMWSRMWARSWPNAVWYINQDCLPQLMTMTLDAGTAGTPVYMPPGGLSQAPYGTLMGRPVIPVEYCSTLGTVGDIILADFSQYVMIDKGGINSQSSIHVRFLQDETVYKFTLRADGQCIWNSALTPASGSANTLSPFVVLESR